MHKFYPIYLTLDGRRVVVIGGGEVAERKVESLLGTGASITVISPDVTARIESLAQEEKIQLHRRVFQTGDCAGAALIFSATDDAHVSAAVFHEASQIGALVNTADQPNLCDFIMPAVMRRGDIAIAVSTGGSSPALAAQLRDRISSVIGPEYSELAELLSSVRQEIRRRVPDVQQRTALHSRILNSDIIDYLRRNDSAGAGRRLREIIES